LFISFFAATFINRPEVCMKEEGGAEGNNYGCSVFVRPHVSPSEPLAGPSGRYAEGGAQPRIPMITLDSNVVAF